MNLNQNNIAVTDDQVHDVSNTVYDRCIVLDNSIPVFITSDIDEAVMYMSRSKELKLIEFKKIYDRIVQLHNLSDQVSDNVNPHELIDLCTNVLCLSKSGLCSHSYTIFYDKTTQTFKTDNESINLITTKGDFNTKYINPKNDTIYRPYNTIATTITTKTDNLKDVPVKNMQLPLITPGKRYDVYKNRVKQPTDIDTALTIVQSSLSSIKRDEKENSIDLLENLYENLEEEAILDYEINQATKELDELLIGDEKCEIAYDYDSDSEDEEDMSDTSSSRVEEEGSDLEPSPDLPEHVNQIIIERNALKNEIKKNEIIIAKANEKLNDELFEQRCKEQERRNAEKKQHEKMSIFRSDKNTYLQFRSKIREGIQKERNITPFFNYKYRIIKFMEQNDLISFKKNVADEVIEDEVYTYEQLFKVIQSYERNISDSNNESFDDSKENSEHDPMDDIDEEYLDLCEDFLRVISESDTEVITSNRIHDILNNDPKLKEQLFYQPINQSVFNKDTDKEEYKREEEPGNY